jgi:hypothetical protein
MAWWGDRARREEPIRHRRIAVDGVLDVMTLAILTGARHTSGLACRMGPPGRRASARSHFDKLI